MTTLRLILKQFDELGELMLQPAGRKSQLPQSDLSGPVFTRGPERKDVGSRGSSGQPTRVTLYCNLRQVQDSTLEPHTLVQH